MRRHRFFLLCTVGLCVISFLHYYKALHYVSLLRELSAPYPNIKSFIMVTGFFWREKGAATTPLSPSSPDEAPPFPGLRQLDGKGRVMAGSQGGAGGGGGGGMSLGSVDGDGIISRQGLEMRLKEEPEPPHPWQKPEENQHGGAPDELSFNVRSFITILYKWRDLERQIGTERSRLLTRFQTLTSQSFPRTSCNHWLSTPQALTVATNLCQPTALYPELNQWHWKNTCFLSLQEGDEDHLKRQKPNGAGPNHPGAPFVRKEHGEDRLPDPIEMMGDHHTRLFHLQDDKTPFFVRTKAGALCFRQGTEVAAPKEYSAKAAGSVANGDGEGAPAMAGGQRKPLEVQQQPSLTPKARARSRGSGKRLVKCVCRPGWHGPYCGVPTMVYHSNLPTKERLTPRETPRRVINAININHEFDLLHARLHELADAVDLFLICESNFTAYGDKRPLT